MLDRLLHRFRSPEVAPIPLDMELVVAAQRIQDESKEVAEGMKCLMELHKKHRIRR